MKVKKIVVTILTIKLVKEIQRRLKKTIHRKIQIGLLSWGGGEGGGGRENPVIINGLRPLGPNDQNKGENLDLPKWA